MRLPPNRSSRRPPRIGALAIPTRFPTVPMPISIGRPRAMPIRTAPTDGPSALGQLSPGDWAVLGLLVEAPRHGFAITQVMAAEGELGRIWRVRQALVYCT